MTYSIVFNSITGNTAALADQIHNLLPNDTCVYFGDPSREALETDADLTFVGFRTENGRCDSVTSVFLKKLDKRTITLFAYSVSHSDSDYFKRMLSAAESEIPVSNTVLPGFMCGGKDEDNVQKLENWVNAYTN
jgi:flavodoxin